MADHEMVEIPRWVQRTVLPQRTRDSVSKALRREGLVAGTSFAIVVLVGVVWGSSAAPLPFWFWVNLVIFFGAAYRWRQISSARNWLDSKSGWGAIAELPKSAHELRLERWRISDAWFWSVVLTVLVGVVALAIVIVGRG